MNSFPALPAALAFAVVISLSAPANADVIDLSSLPLGSFTAPLAAGEFVLTPRNDGSAAPTIQDVNGVYVLTATGNYSNGDDVFLTLADGAAFNLNSVDIGLLPGYGSSGQSVSSTASDDGLNGVATSSPQTISFGTRFADVTSIDLDATGGAFFENINVSAVPEPASWALMIAGLAGLIGLAAGRRTHAPAA